MKRIWQRVGLSGQVIGAAVVLMATGILAAQFLLLRSSEALLTAEISRSVVTEGTLYKQRVEALGPIHREGNRLEHFRFSRTRIWRDGDMIGTRLD